MTSREELVEILSPKEVAEAASEIRKGLPSIVEDEHFDEVRYAMLMMIASAEQVYKEYTRMQEINSKLEEEQTNDTDSN